jgi:hypothetical protein
VQIAEGASLNAESRMPHAKGAKNAKGEEKRLV